MFTYKINEENKTIDFENDCTILKSAIRKYEYSNDPCRFILTQNFLNLEKYQEFIEEIYEKIIKTGVATYNESSGFKPSNNLIFSREYNNILRNKYSYSILYNPSCHDVGTNTFNNAKVIQNNLIVNTISFKDQEETFSCFEECFNEFSKLTGMPVPKVYKININDTPYNSVFIVFDENWVKSRMIGYMILKFMRTYIYIKLFNSEVIKKSNYSEFFKVFIARNGPYKETNEEIRKIYGKSEEDFIFDLYSNMKHIIEDIDNYPKMFLSDIISVLRHFIVTLEKVKKNMKVEYNYKLVVWSRHPSHAPLRNLPISKPVTLRFGFRVKDNESSPKTKYVINDLEAIKNSASKFKMKNCFEEKNVTTAAWVIPNNQKELEFFCDKFEGSSFIVKSEMGSRGEGLVFMENKEDVIKWFNTPYTQIKKQKYGNYLVEKYYNYSREYRLHINKDGCFYTCRKMLKTESETRWYRNDDNCVWITEQNEMFQKPFNWNKIVEECVKALNAVGLDFGACDVIVQSQRDKKNNIRQEPKFIICEINSAPGLGEVGLEIYKKELTNYINNL